MWLKFLISRFPSLVFVLHQLTSCPLQLPVCCGLSEAWLFSLGCSVDTGTLWPCSTVLQYCIVLLTFWTCSTLRLLLGRVWVWFLLHWDFQISGRRHSGKSFLFLAFSKLCNLCITFWGCLQPLDLLAAAWLGLWWCQASSCQRQWSRCWCCRWGAPAAWW